MTMLNKLNYNYQNLVLSYIKKSKMKFALDEDVLVSGLAVGAIPQTGIFSTSEVVTGIKAGSVMLSHLNNNTKLANILYPKIDLASSLANFPLVNSDSSKIIDPEGITIGLSSPSYPAGQPFSETAYPGDAQGYSLLCLPKDFIRVTDNTSLVNKLEEQNQWAISSLAYFIVQMDISGTHPFSEDYLEMKQKYITFYSATRLYPPDKEKLGTCFDQTYANREEWIYKPFYQKFIETTK